MRSRWWSFRTAQELSVTERTVNRWLRHQRRTSPHAANSGTATPSLAEETAVGLKQQTGHLTRADEDHGTATILVRRVVFKFWGNLLM
jgi:hypothetical protein